MNDTSSISTKVASWFVNNPAERDWLLQNKAQNDFAASLFDSLNQWGGLTENQIGAIRKNLARVNNKPVAVESAKLEEFFAHARESGLKWPRVTLHNVKVTMAGPNSRNPGSLYVKRDEEYLGKITSGVFYKIPECSSEEAEEIAELLADPEAVMKEYGLKTGCCCMCSRELTNPISIEYGMGPICRGRFGMEV
jgi:hypothetical protein